MARAEPGWISEMDESYRQYHKHRIQDQKIMYGFCDDELSEWITCDNSIHRATALLRAKILLKIANE